MNAVFTFYSEEFTEQWVCNMTNQCEQYSEAIGNCIFNFIVMVCSLTECVALFEHSERNECIHDMPCLSVLLSVWVDVIIPELLVFFLFEIIYRVIYLSKRYQVIFN